MEGIRAKDLTASFIFVDFSKAFDTVHRGKMKEILAAYGIPQDMVNAIMVLYNDTQAMVRSPDGDTDLFDILSGVLQGDTLAPLLFIICLDYVLRTSIDLMPINGFTLEPERSKRYQAKRITDADYADDLALISDTVEQAEALLHSLEAAANGIGLQINADKTKIMNFNIQGNFSTLEGHQLKVVKDFVYLGSHISTTEKDITVRIGKAWTALSKLNTIWKSNLPDNIKRNFFQAIVTSVLLYGSNTWTLTKKLETKLDGTYTRMLRAVLNTSWKSHPTKTYLLGNLSPLSQTIKKRRTRFAGHSWRNKTELISDVILWNPRHGQSRVGRPHRTYIDQLCDDAECDPEHLPNLIANREEWRKRVVNIRANRSPR